MIFRHEVKRILDGQIDRNAIEHFRLGGFHKNVSAKEQKDFESWYRNYNSPLNKEQPSEQSRPTQGEQLALI